MRVAGYTVGAVRDGGEFMPARSLREPIHRHTVFLLTSAFAFASLQQRLIDMQFNALDTGGSVSGENVNIEDHAFNDALTMGRRQDPHLWYGWCWAGLRRGRGRAGEVAGDKPRKAEQQG